MAVNDVAIRCQVMYPMTIQILTMGFFQWKYGKKKRFPLYGQSSPRRSAQMEISAVVHLASVSPLLSCLTTGWIRSSPGNRGGQAIRTWFCASPSLKGWDWPGWKLSRAGLGTLDKPLTNLRLHKENTSIFQTSFFSSFWVHFTLTDMDRNYHLIACAIYM